MRLLSFSAAFAVLAGLVMFGCDGTSTNPDVAEKNPGNGGKGPQVLESECLDVLQGIHHCTIGNTDLAYDQLLHQVNVTNFGSLGRDGVSSTFSSAKHWTQDGDVEFPARGGRLRYAAISGGQAVSTLNIEKISDDQMSVAPTFTGAPEGFQYRVEVYNGNNLVASETGLDANSPSTRYLANGGCYVKVRKFNSTGLGECSWELVWVSPCLELSVHLPSGDRVDGNRIVFTEVIQNGQYPYRNFDGINVRGVVESYEISSESATP